MIKSIQQVQFLVKELTTIKNIVQDLQYKIVKNLDASTDLYVYAASTDLSVYTEILKETGKSELDNFPIINVTIIDSEDYKEESAYYKAWFAENNQLDGTVLRLDNATNKYPLIKVAGVAPVMSFYSYKGGVGRTTTLAAFASYHARSTGARVFMIDCDFEAPGFANFFGLDQQKLEQKGGVVEFLTDTINLQNTDTIDKNLMDDYVHEVSRSSAGAVSGYAGEGLIQIMLAGNLSSSATTDRNTDVEDVQIADTEYANIDTHIDHYLHGLARLDFANAEYIGQRFALLLQAIQKNYNPDVILIDSRTGFNDIFSNVVLRVSDVLVGFFGTSIQNVPGIYNFMKTVQHILPNEDGSTTAMQKNIDVFMISAMSPDSPQSLRDFKKIVSAYPLYTEILNNNISNWAIGYHPELATIGTPKDNEGDTLLRFTNPKSTQYPSYSNGDDTYLLEELSKKAVEKKTKIDTPILVETTSTPSKTIEIITKKEILEPIADFLLNKNYAENIPLTNEFIDNYFYFRNYLSDLFNKDTFIVRGYKGTGKTLLYNALQDKYFIQKLKVKCRIKENFDFCAVIDKATLQDIYGLANLHKFRAYYSRFWKIYVWNTLIVQTNFESKLPPFNVIFTLAQTTWAEFEERMKDHNMFIIENDLRVINEKLKTENTKIILTFDHLDILWSPHRWADTDNPIADLFKFCNANPFSNIYFKIFVRTDLYTALTGITNKPSLEPRTLRLEWGKEELFAYFFKIVFTVTEHKFMDWLYLHHENIDSIHEIKNISIANNNEIPTDRKDILQALVDEFFGKYFNMNYPNNSVSFDWFHYNLKNANDLISIRPFIVLIQEAISLILEKRHERESTESIILSGKYYGDSRCRLAAGKHSFIDIAQQNGYKYLNVFAKIVAERDHPNIVPYRKMNLSEYDLKKLLENVDEIAQREKLTQTITRSDEVKKMLIETGILYENSTIYNRQYTFAFLYKNYFNLSSKTAK